MTPEERRAVVLADPRVHVVVQELLRTTVVDSVVDKAVELLRRIDGMGPPHD
jgi:hypothetical protein